jgi:hypothetical protein
MRVSYLICLLITMAASSARSEDLKFGGFIDTYYAYDFNEPANHEREFTTQPVRHNEFNINLAYIEAVIDKKLTRGRLAIQFGNSAVKNMAGESTLGSTSGPANAHHLQEVFIGKKIGDKTWIDAGIFFSSIGSESWLSKDNWTYTRSLLADYTPYYWTGLRLEHFIDNRQTLQVHLINGWQAVAENNEAKAVSFRYENKLKDHTLSYALFFGDEEVVSERPRFRGYHNFIWEWRYSQEWQLLFGFDLGHASQQENDGVDGWYASVLRLRHNLDSQRSITFRIESFQDRHQATVFTGTTNGFKVSSASINYDHHFEDKILWRTELRGFRSKDEIYPQGRQGFNYYNGFLVTSLSLGF